MQTLRAADDRGRADLGWLQSRHSFSFGQYFDPQHQGHGPLRVINEDRVQPGRGFGAHSHRDMEILSIVLEGALAHEDSLGNGSVIAPGDIQRMSAGTGVQHSEFNASGEQPVRFLQIWIEPALLGVAPSYEQLHFGPAERADRLQLVASGQPTAGLTGNRVLSLHQDVDLYRSALAAGASVAHELPAGRLGWVQLLDGAVTVNGQVLAPGDGLALTGPQALRIDSQETAELLLFDMTSTPTGSLS